MSAATAIFSEHITRINTNLVHRLSVGSVLLASALAVFVFGANYGNLFPTNGSRLYNGVLCAVFLLAAAFFKRSSRLAKYWPAAYAFFTAAAVNLVSAFLAGYSTRFLNLFGVQGYSNAGFGLDKLYSTLLAVVPILVLTRLSGAGLGTLYLKRGNQHYRWGYGIGFLVLFDFATSALIFFGSGYRLDQLGMVMVWGAVFAFSNSLLEELWVRGLFLKKSAELIGPVGAVLVTSLAFAAMHFLNVAFLPSAVVPIMVANTITLGLACGVLMIKTESIWGAYLVHAAADLFLWIAILAFH